MKLVSIFIIISLCLIGLISCEKDKNTQYSDLTLNINSFEHNLFELGMEIELIDINYPSSLKIDTVIVYTQCAYREQETDDWDFVTFTSPITPKPSIAIIDTILDFSNTYSMTKNFSFSQAGQYKFIFSIDPENIINETDETNNTKSTGIGQIK